MAKSKNKLQWKFLKLNGVIDRRYKISEEGDVWDCKKGDYAPVSPMYKKSPFNGSDYQRVSLNGKAYRLHRVVCETYHGPAPAGQNVVLHLDEYKDNNHKDNLSWGTPAQNSQGWIHSIGGVMPRHSLAKIRRAKKLINKGYTNDKVATMTKIGDSTISLIKLGRLHRTVEPLTERQIELGNV
jgi:hypothetical protein